jgi:hypothetical protein
MVTQKPALAPTMQSSISMRGVCPDAIVAISQKASVIIFPIANTPAKFLLKRSGGPC